MIRNHPKGYLLSVWLMFFLYDQLISLFYPFKYPFFFTVLNFLFGTIFILFLFFVYFPAIRNKAEIGFLSLKLIELSVFLTVIKFILTGFDDLSFTQPDKYLLLEEILRYQEFTFFALLWWMVRKLIVNFQKIITVTIELYKAQADLDHAILGPHFLFNALNNVAGRSSIYSESLYYQIMDLSYLLQQAYKLPSDPHFLHDEIAVLNRILNLVGAQQDNLHINLQIESDKHLQYLRIPKLTLGTLMENMIKYGVIDDETNPAEMLIEIQTGEDGNTRLICSTWNLIHKIRASFSSGRGLPALRRLLRGEFGEDSTFEWNQNSDEFKTLTIINYGCIEAGTYR
ncbi:LytS family sensor histidine kinase [Algoriphagus halophytocola]|uniref:Signal transduction histidine kinase internal region domain-containing protein n=1 Tax=Algoriphagus halophytocola TaxID=2991499 RepID=A0ABY6MH56_9BACT|nr:hypothetical protein [Algoriphagus sp. TR-M5]UZD22983.1 hypothetical protein OM944_00510 [Algoriphagus sp. TR-M5]